MATSPLERRLGADAFVRAAKRANRRAINYKKFCTERPYLYCQQIRMRNLAMEKARSLGNQ